MGRSPFHLPPPFFDPLYLPELKVGTVFRTVPAGFFLPPAYLGQVPPPPFCPPISPRVSSSYSVVPRQHTQVRPPPSSLVTYQGRSSTLIFFNQLGPTSPPPFLFPPLFPPFPGRCYRSFFCFFSFNYWGPEQPLTGTVPRP